MDKVEYDIPIRLPCLTLDHRTLCKQLLRILHPCIHKIMCICATAALATRFPVPSGTASLNAIEVILHEVPLQT